MNDLIQSSKAIIDRAFEGSDENGKIILQFTLYQKKNPLLGLAVKGSLKESGLNTVYDEISSHISKMRVKSDSCVFQHIYAVSKSTLPQLK